MVVRPPVTLPLPRGPRRRPVAPGEATPVRQTSRRGILEDGSRPAHERLTTSAEGTLQVSDVSRVNIPIASAKSEASNNDLRQIRGVKPGLENRYYTTMSLNPLEARNDSARIAFR